MGGFGMPTIDMLVARKRRREDTFETTITPHDQFRSTRGDAQVFRSPGGLMPDLPRPNAEPLAALYPSHGPPISTQFRSIDPHQPFQSVAPSNDGPPPPPPEIPATPPQQGWALNSSTFERFDNNMPDAFVQVREIDPQFIVPALRRIEDCARRLGVQARYDNDPVAAKFVTLEDVEIYFKAFQADNNGPVVLTFQLVRGDQLIARRYNRNFCRAALGVFRSDAEAPTTPGPLDARFILTFENYLRLYASCSKIERSVNDADTTPQNVVEGLLCDLFQAFDTAEEASPRLGLATLQLSTNTEHGVGYELTTVQVDEALHIPRSFALAYPHGDRNSRIRIYNSGGSNPRAKKVYLVSINGNEAYNKTSFPVGEPLPFGRLLFCETLIKERDGNSYRETEDKWRSMVAIVEVAIDRLEGQKIVAFLTARMLKCVNAYQRDAFVFFVCHVKSYYTMANTMLSPEPSLQVLNVRNGLATQYGEERVKGTFRNYVQSVDSAFRGGFCPVNVDQSNLPRYMAPEIHSILYDPRLGDPRWAASWAAASSWSLGVLLYELITGLEFPLPSDRTYLFWIARSGFFNTCVPGSALSVLDRIDTTEARGQFDTKICARLFDSIRAVQRMPPLAARLLEGLLREDPNSRLSFEQILNCRWLTNSSS